MQCVRGHNFANQEENLRSVPYVPNAVKEHYRRIEEERQMTEIEIANQERGLKLQLEKEDRYVLLIQRTWRGFKCRGAIEVFLQERRLWFDKRIADTHLRTKFGYKISCLLGMGRLLESDTPHETVIKKVPFWARKTIIDIIQGRYMP